jgi:hypothetical protein
MWYYFGKEGEAKRRIDDTLAPEAEGWTLICQLERQPEEYEVVDEATGQCVMDAAAIDSNLSRIIDMQAGEVRARFITVAPGMDMTYLRKEREAREWTEGANPEDFPLLACEAQVKGASVGAIAALVRSKADQWAYVAALIEAARMGAKQAVQAATTIEAKKAAAVVDWAPILELL